MPIPKSLLDIQILIICRVSSSSCFASSNISSWFARSPRPNSPKPLLTQRNISFLTGPHFPAKCSRSVACLHFLLVVHPLPHPMEICISPPAGLTLPISSQQPTINSLLFLRSRSSTSHFLLVYQPSKHLHVTRTQCTHQIAHQPKAHPISQQQPRVSATAFVPFVPLNSTSLPGMYRTLTTLRVM